MRIRPSPARERRDESRKSTTRSPVVRAARTLVIVLAALILVGIAWRARLEPDKALANLSGGPASATGSTPAVAPIVALERALIDILAEPDPAKRRRDLHAWFRAALPSRLGELQQIFAQMHEQTNPDLFTAFQVFLEEWGALDGTAAYRFVGQAPPRSGIDGYAEFAIRGWLRTDFDGLWRFVQAQHAGVASDEDKARWAVTYFTEAFLDTAPERFFAWVEDAGRQSPSHVWAEIVRTAAFHANDTTVERVAEWLRRNDAQLTARDLLGEFTRRFVEMKPQQAASWATSLEQPEQRGAAAVVVARRLAGQDFALGVQWLGQPEVMQSLRSARAEWRNGEKPASGYDAAVYEYLTTLARHHGDDPLILKAAESSIATVEDPDVRRHLAARLEEVRITYFGRPTQ